MQIPDSVAISLIVPLAFIFGAVFGSFVTLASWRLPLGEDIVSKPSRCPSCDTKLTVRDLFPLFSWLAQGGRCRHCKTAISVRYPLIELVTGAVFAALAAAYGPTPTTLILCLLATALMVLIVTDLEHTIIPDSVQVAVFILGCAWAWHTGKGWQGPAIGFASGLALGLSLHYGWLIFRKKDALGLGDVKFLAAAGVWIPLADFPAFLFLAGLTGTIFGLIWQRLGRGAIFPFGPALAISLFINVLIPDMIYRLL